MLFFFGLMAYDLYVLILIASLIYTLLPNKQNWSSDCDSVWGISDSFLKLWFIDLFAWSIKKNSQKSNLKYFQYSILIFKKKMSHWDSNHFWVITRTNLWISFESIHWCWAIALQIHKYCIYNVFSRWYKLIVLYIIYNSLTTFIALGFFVVYGRDLLKHKVAWYILSSTIDLLFYELISNLTNSF